MTSVFVIGNCHLYAMQRSLKFFDAALYVDGCHLWDLRERYGSGDALVAHVRAFDHVLSCSFDGSFLSGLTSRVLAERVEQTVLYPTVTFGAFHPDVVYALERGRQAVTLSGVMGPHHSALVLYGYRKGFGIERTARLFRSEIFDALGYLSTWDAALDEFAGSAGGDGYGLGHLASRWLRQGCFMHNPQHPKVQPICDIARVAMDRMRLERHHPDPAPFIPDDLIFGHVWPLYPEIGSFYGLPGNYTFKRQSGPSPWPEYMSLEDFIGASYEVYDGVDLAAYDIPRVDGWLADGAEL